MNDKGSANQVKVQFSDEINTEHSSHIQVELTNQLLVNVHLGFLQIRHRYEIVFTFECPQFLENAFVLDSPQSLYANIVELKAIGTNKDCIDKPPSTLYRVTAEIFAYKEKLLKEKITIGSRDNQLPTFVFHARVLGTGKGTPSLKEGIKCIGIEADEDDDNSDFPSK